MGVLNLYLTRIRNHEIILLPKIKEFSMDKVVQSFCKKNELTEAQFYGHEPVGGSLDLRSLTSIPEGFNPTVGGWLALGSLTSIPEGFNPTVGGSLYLGGKYRNDLKVDLTENYVFEWSNGYIKIDGIFSKVIARKGNTWKTQRIGGATFEYIVTDGHGKYAHGDSIREAKESLIYKISDRDTSRFQGLALDTVLTFGELVEAYRIITGACEVGVRGFIQSSGLEKKSYSIAEAIKLTGGQYGSEKFREFFGNGR
jgi:hypothetical protein